MAGKVNGLLNGRLEAALIEKTERHERGAAIRELRDEIIETLTAEDEDTSPKDVQAAIDDKVKKYN